MNRHTNFILGCALLTLGSGAVLAQDHPRGDAAREPSRGNVERGRGHAPAYRGGNREPAHRGGNYGPGYRGGNQGPAYYGGNRGPAHAYGHRGAANVRGYYPYGYFVPPLAAYYGPTYYSYPAYEAPVYITQEYVYPEPPPPSPPPAVYYRPRQLAQAAPPPPPPAPVPQPTPPPAPRFEKYTLSASELFEFDRDQLRMPQPKLDEIAAALAANTQIASVHITGYTDRLGTDAYNLKLSQRRADAVKAYLVYKGVAANRLVAIGKGEADPVVQCKETQRAALIECLEPNRRVEVESITIERIR